MKTAKQASRLFKKRRDGRFIFHVQYASGTTTLPRARQLHRWARAAIQPGTDSAEVLLRIVDTEEGCRLNREYRGKDYPTNVLTFTLHTVEGVGATRSLAGDIVLTAPVIETEAHEQDLILDAHYAHLVIHAMLHLQGYDHQNDADAYTMETLETSVLQRLGYSDPYGNESI